MKPSQKQLQKLAKIATELNLNFHITSNFSFSQYIFAIELDGIFFHYLILSDGLYGSYSKEAFKIFINDKQRLWDLYDKLRDFKNVD